MQRIIGVLSGKGGVGKTTVVINLALALQGMNENVTAIDGDLSTGNLGLHLGCHHFPLTLLDVLVRNTSLSDATYVHSSGLRFVPVSIPLPDFKIKSSKLKKMFKGLDGIVLVDSSPGLHKQSLDVLRACNEILIVMTPDISSLMNAMKVANAAQGSRKKILGIIVNMVSGKDCEFTEEEIANAFEAPIVGTIPEDSSVKEAAFKRIPLVKYKELAPASIAFRRMAARLVNKEYRPPKFLRMKRLLRLG